MSASSSSETAAAPQRYIILLSCSGCDCSRHVSNYSSGIEDVSFRFSAYIQAVAYHYVHEMREQRFVGRNVEQILRTTDCGSSVWIINKVLRYQCDGSPRSRKHSL